MKLKSVINMIGKENFVSRIIAGTEEMFNVPVVEKGHMSSKAAAILDVVQKKDFGCKKESVLALCEVLTGEKLLAFYEKNEDTLTPVLWAAVVFVNEEQGYSENSKFVIVDTEEEIMIPEDDEDDEVSYCKDEFLREDIRPATQSEIRKMVDYFYE